MKLLTTAFAASALLALGACTNDQAGNDAAANDAAAEAEAPAEEEAGAVGNDADVDGNAEKPAEGEPAPGSDKPATDDPTDEAGEKPTE